MKVIILMSVFVVGIYLGLHAEEGGRLEVIVETIASAVITHIQQW
jgi:hypothetical protein